MRLSSKAAFLALGLAVLASCAAPRTTAPPAEPVPPEEAPAPAVPLPPAPAREAAPPPEEPEYAALLREDPVIAAATADLEAAPPDLRPAALMHRAREAFAAARDIRSRVKGPAGFTGWPPDRELFVAYCELALRDLGEVLDSHGDAPESAEAIFTVGRIRDYPYYNQFEEALEAYRLTIERHPGSPWARRAAERMRLVEGMIGGEGLRGEGAEPRP